MVFEPPSPRNKRSFNVQTGAWGLETDLTIPLASFLLGFISKRNRFPFGFSPRSGNQKETRLPPTRFKSRRSFPFYPKRDRRGRCPMIMRLRSPRKTFSKRSFCILLLRLERRRSFRFLSSSGLEMSLILSIFPREERPLKVDSDRCRFFPFRETRDGSPPPTLPPAFRPIRESCSRIGDPIPQISFFHQHNVR